jgi:hypothetical protein
MYKFVFDNERTVTSNSGTLPKRLGLKIVRVYVRSSVTGKYVRIV